MANWYVRRGEKVVGPVDGERLKDLAKEGKVLPTDLLAADVSGPWTQASRTSIFSKQPPELPVAAQTELAPTAPLNPIVRNVDQPPTESSDSPISPVSTVARGGLAIIKVFGRGTLTAGSALTRWYSLRSHRRHEIKLAKIQAQTVAESKRKEVTRPSAFAPPPPASITVSPRIVQTTVVKVVNKNSGSCGCSGCAVVLLLIIIGIVALVIYSEMNPTSP